VWFNDITFASPSNGWAVGRDGNILATTDGGTSWFSQKSETWRNLEEVCFVDGQTGYAAGWVYTLLKTTDAGRTWVNRYFGRTENLFTVFFISPECGWVGGQNGLISRTTNSGTNWRHYQTGTGQNIQSLWFLDKQTGWAVGNQGLVLKTVNGGTQWSHQESGVSEVLLSVQFTGPMTGWAVGWYGTLIKTTDGGGHWERQDSGTLNHLVDIDFVDASTAYIAGWYGTILKSTDGGESWYSQISSTSEWLNGMHWIDANRGWVVGTEGTILHTENGGGSMKVPPRIQRLTDLVLMDGSSHEILLDSCVTAGVDPDQLAWRVSSSDIHVAVELEDNRVTISSSGWQGTATVEFKVIDPDGAFDVQGIMVTVQSVSLVNGQAGTPGSFALRQNFPNPFNAKTRIAFQLPIRSRVRFTVYNTLGRQIAVLADGEREPGTHELAWDASPWPSGLYLGRLEWKGGVLTKKMLLEK
jgi:photosystem II stability/assembly factor-like uncharacterized protein